MVKSNEFALAEDGIDLCVQESVHAVLVLLSTPGEAFYSNGVSVSCSPGLVSCHAGGSLHTVAG